MQFGVDPENDHGFFIKKSVRTTNANMNNCETVGNSGANTRAQQVEYAIIWSHALTPPPSCVGFRVKKKKKIRNKINIIVSTGIQISAHDVGLCLVWEVTAVVVTTSKTPSHV